MNTEKTVAVLFAREDSYYKTLDACDVYDKTRDALTFTGKAPIVAHPPCRGWGRLRKQAKAPELEKCLAFWAVMKVRENGGVLEHPAQSSLFKQMALPRPGMGPDIYGGFTISLPQFWFGHRAEKPTWFYICGIDRQSVPEIPILLGRAPRVITRKKGLLSGMPGYRKEVTIAEREETPAALAKWLVELARRTQSREAVA
ncbi:MAG: hypothetical protein CML13_16045 [Puniceicoccaceae bacterium]|nr:hypothetical protein [Puniceicoccaceae bacterium]|tara:strand:+ start:4440 stop:5039 length:600 start_codon:yes stop_codon:yes gene_type:complete